MSLISNEFFIFFLFSLLAHYVLPVKFRWVSLLVFSLYYFFSYTGFPSCVFFIAAVFVTSAAVYFIRKSVRDGKSKTAKAALTVGITVNLGMLAFMKYTGFILGIYNSAAAVFHLPLCTFTVPFSAPLGISFYTLQSISYMLDIYWDIVENPTSNPLRVALYLGYYPQTLSGPLHRFNDTSSSLYAGGKASRQDISYGLVRMLWGIFKKIVIAGRLASPVALIYGNTDVYSGIYIWLAAAAYTLQLYADFSGYMDIILGASMCYGIVLPENFDSPFFSSTIQEFWQRWHMTLGTWLKNYIMYPLQRSAAIKKFTRFLKEKVNKKASRQIPAYICMLAVWLLIGLWHGGGWNYILGQGMWFWFWIVLEQLMAPVMKKTAEKLSLNKDGVVCRIIAALRVMILASIGNIFFYSDSLKTAFAVLKAGFCSSASLSFEELGLSVGEWITVFAALALLLTVSVLRQKVNLREKYDLLPPPAKLALFLSMLLIILLFGQYGLGYDASQFIYGSF